VPGVPFALLGKARPVSCDLKRVLLVALAIGTGGCQLPPSNTAPTAAPPAAGLAFAQASCGGCHAIGRYGASPNPSSPPFAGIVNQPGLTAATLSTWLRDAHNYPEEMEFYLEGREVDDLVAYMMTLRDAKYRPAI
jgi:mono/diheme cytochrome c family protein